MRAGQASRAKTRSTGGILGWIALAAMAGLLILVAFAVLVSGAPYYLTPDPLRPTHALDPRFAPGAPVGLLLGMVGSTLMTVLLLYSARKWLPFTSFMGAPAFWMRFHLMCGILGPVFIALHGALTMPNGFIGVGFWCMWLVAGSGIFGRYLFGYFPAAVADRRTNLDQAQEALAQLRGQLVEDTKDSDSELVSEAISLVRDFDREARSLAQLLVLDAEVRRRADLVDILLHRAGLEPEVRERATEALVAQLWIRRSIGGYDAARRALRFWNLLHQPLAAGMYSIALLHILNAFLFGGVVRTLLEALP